MCVNYDSQSFILLSQDCTSHEPGRSAMHVLLVLKWQKVVTTGMATMLDELPLAREETLTFSWEWEVRP